jgi:hypothetical protein
MNRDKPFLAAIRPTIQKAWYEDNTIPLLDGCELAHCLVPRTDLWTGIGQHVAVPHIDALPSGQIAAEVQIIQNIEKQIVFERLYLLDRNLNPISICSSPKAFSPITGNLNSGV